MGKKLEASNHESQEEHLLFSRDTTVSRRNEEYVTRSSDEIERKVANRIYLEFSRTENRILRAVFKLDEFFLDSQVPVPPENLAKISSYISGKKHKQNNDRAFNDPHLDVIKMENRVPHTFFRESISVHH